MATLEDTFRMMKGDEPVNTDKISEKEMKVHESKNAFNSLGNPSGKS